MNRVLFVLTAAIWILASTAAFADPPDEAEALFRKADITEDGILSGTERKGYEGFDTNGDRRITKDEFRAGLAARTDDREKVTLPQLQAEYRKLDMNEDETLTGKEVGPYAASDADGNGELSFDEYKAARLRRAVLVDGAGSAAPQAGSMTAIAVDRSPLVERTPMGLSVVAPKAGPMPGVEIAYHHKGTTHPSLGVTPDGAIHAIFWEKHTATNQAAVYYRATTDGGTTWSPAKNLTEDIPDFGVGPCSMAVDGAGRVYVCWKQTIRPSAAFSGEIYGANGSQVNLMYRVLAAGAWSKVIQINPRDKEEYYGGVYSAVLATDPRGNVHAMWSTNPAAFHFELTASDDPAVYGQHLSTVSQGLIMRSRLDGATASPAEEIHRAEILPKAAAHKYDKMCDGYDSMRGLVDEDGVPHLIAVAARTNYSAKPRIVLIKGKTAEPLTEILGETFPFWTNPNFLIRDAAGRLHRLERYEKGEQPGIRDHQLGADAPQFVMQTKTPTGKIGDFGVESFSGGRALCWLQMSHSGAKDEWELFVSLFDGTTWSEAVCVTSNGSRKAFAATLTSPRSNIALGTWYSPGRAAAAVDKDGRLVMLLQVNENSIFSSSAFGVVMASGSTTEPKLFFVRF